MALTKTAGTINPAVGGSAQDVAFSWGRTFLMLFAIVTIGRIQEVIPALESAHIGVMAGGLAGLMWLLTHGTLRDKIPMSIPQVKYVVWLFLLAALIIPISVWPGNSFDFVTGTYWKVVLFYLMVVFFTRSVGDVRGMLWASCLGVCALVLLGLAFGGGDSERFQAGSVTYDANDLALVLVIALPLLIYLFSISAVPSKVLAAAMIFICFYGIVLTQSRGGFLALLGVGLLIISRSTIGMAAKIGIIVLALVVFGSLAGIQYWDRMSTIWSPQSEYDETAGGRTELWKTGLQILATHPWGVGIDGFKTAEGLSHGGFGKWSAAHNSFLQIGVELGLVGFFIFVVLISTTIWDLRRIKEIRKENTTGKSKTVPSPVLREALRFKEPPKDGVLPLAATLETSLWGFVIGGLFLDQAYSPLLYCVLALSLACKRMAQGREKQPGHPDARINTLHWPNVNV